MSTSITYNGVNLNSSTIITSDVNDGDAPDRNLTLFNLILTGGGTITDSTYYTKRITVKGLLKQTTVALLEDLIDTFHGYFNVQDKNLDIGYGSGTRRYVCTAKKVSIDRPVRGANWANFEIDFVATENGKDTASTDLLVNSSQTYSPYTNSLAIAGSAPNQYLTFEITLTTVTPDASNYISIKNDTSGEELTITRTWLQTDVLLVDTELQEVRVNGTLVDFTGAFPLFSNGTHDLIITSDFTVTNTYTSNATFTAPANITNVTVKAWGGGGAGEGKTANGGGGGGGGGAYAESEVTVVPASGYAVVVGAAATGGTGTGPNGADATFAATTVVAKGGTGGAAGVGGIGGLSSTSVGDIVYAGGDAGDGGIAGTAGGGGGEAASDLGSGNNGTDAFVTIGGLGGSGNTNGGDGGNGRDLTEGDGVAGTASGGGGGGAFRTSANKNGGSGALGKVTVTYSSFTFSIDAYYTKRWL